MLCFVPCGFSLQVYTAHAKSEHEAGWDMDRHAHHLELPAFHQHRYKHTGSVLPARRCKQNLVSAKILRSTCGFLPYKSHFHSGYKQGIYKNVTSVLFSYVYISSSRALSSPCSGIWCEAYNSAATNAEECTSLVDWGFGFRHKDICSLSNHH